MAVTNVACPHCGKETLMTVPSNDNSVIKVQQGSFGHHSGQKTTVACQNCDQDFYGWYK